MVRGFMHLRYFPLAVLIAIFGASGCKDAHRGQSNANEAPVPDGHIVLLRRSNEVAAVILRNQTFGQTDFSWYYRADGKGTFHPGDPAVSTGTVSNASRISFATFSLEWSGNTTGKGWVYFSAGPAEFRKTADFVMCVTTETYVATIDAANRRWNYRGRPGINVRALIESQVKE